MNIFSDEEDCPEEPCISDDFMPCSGSGSRSLCIKKSTGSDVKESFCRHEHPDKQKYDLLLVFPTRLYPFFNIKDDSENRIEIIETVPKNAENMIYAGKSKIARELKGFKIQVFFETPSNIFIVK